MADAHPNDKATYLELKWRYDGLNNGRVGLGCRELAEALKSSKDTARRSLERLMERGLIAKAKPSGFNVKDRTATEWRLTEYACDRSNHPATKDFMRWQPKEKTQAHHRDREEKTQAHQKDAQAHQKDIEHPDRGQKQPDRRTTGTVKPDLADAQAHQKDTYNITMGGGAQTKATPLSPTPEQRERSASPQDAEASPRISNGGQGVH